MTRVCLAKAARNRIGSARKPKFFGKLASSFEQHRRDFRVDRFVGQSIFRPDNGKGPDK
jgi:hypothetical protein